MPKQKWPRSKYSDASFCVLIPLSPQFVRKSSIDNEIYIMALHRTGNYSLPGTMTQYNDVHWKRRIVMMATLSSLVAHRLSLWQLAVPHKFFIYISFVVHMKLGTSCIGNFQLFAWNLYMYLCTEIVRFTNCKYVKYIYFIRNPYEFYFELQWTGLQGNFSCLSIWWRERKQEVNNVQRVLMRLHHHKIHRQTSNKSAS